MAYTLVTYDLGDGFEMRVLATTQGCPGDENTFIDNLKNASGEKSRLTRILKQAKRIEENGIDWAFCSQSLRMLENDIALCELKVKGSVIRVMTYMHNKEKPVYLFDFDGHRGKTGKVSKNDMKKGRKLAQAARECLEREGE